MTPNDRLLSRQEVQRIVGVSRTTLYRHVENGVLPNPVRVGRLLKWRSVDIETYLNSLK